eukprot:6190513-Pleurochrysis_carterae.AAC.1
MTPMLSPRHASRAPTAAAGREAIASAPRLRGLLLRPASTALDAAAGSSARRQHPPTRPPALPNRLHRVCLPFLLGRHRAWQFEALIQPRACSAAQRAESAWPPHRRAPAAVDASYQTPATPWSPVMTRTRLMTRRRDRACLRRPRAAAAARWRRRRSRARRAAK